MSGRKEYKDVLYLIDFGLSKRYRDIKTGKHVKFINNRRLNGTARYASIHALEGYETSRRDDLEGLCYVLVYFLNGHLPWERIKNKNKQERYKLILNMKKKISEENLVGDRNNAEFIEFVKYCRKLKFEEKPDYDYLRGLMINCINKNNKSVDNFYNINISKNPLFHSQEKNNKPKREYNTRNISQNISGKNTRCNSTKRLKVSFSTNKIVNDNNENIEIIENDDYDNKIINESKSSSLGYIEKKIRNYSNFKNRGIREIQILNKLNRRQNSNIIINNYTQINKNKTSFRNSTNNFNNIQRPSLENKKYIRSRFNFIKKSFGLDEKSNEMIKNDFNDNLGGLKKNISDINENRNNNINEDKDEGCEII